MFLLKDSTHKYNSRRHQAFLLNSDQCCPTSLTHRDRSALFSHGLFWSVTTVNIFSCLFFIFWVFVLGRPQAVWLETAGDPSLHLILDSDWHTGHSTTEALWYWNHRASVVLKLGLLEQTFAQIYCKSLPLFSHWAVRSHSGKEKQVLTTCGLLDRGCRNSLGWHRPFWNLKAVSPSSPSLPDHLKFQCYLRLL